MMELTEEQQQLIQKISDFHESQGFQPVVGRIMGLLYVSSRSNLTFDEIREVLNISKSATSNALNHLLEAGLIEYSTFPGDRKRYFHAYVEDFKQGVISKMNSFLSLSKLLREAIQLNKNSSEEGNAKLLERIEFMEFLSTQVPVLLEQWQKNRS